MSAYIKPHGKSLSFMSFFLQRFTLDFNHPPTYSLEWPLFRYLGYLTFQIGDLTWYGQKEFTFSFQT